MEKSKNPKLNDITTGKLCIVNDDLKSLILLFKYCFPEEIGTPAGTHQYYYRDDIFIWGCDNAKGMDSALASELVKLLPKEKEDMEKIDNSSKKIVFDNVSDNIVSINEITNKSHVGFIQDGIKGSIYFVGSGFLPILEIEALNVCNLTLAEYGVNSSMTTLIKNMKNDDIVHFEVFETRQKLHEWLAKPIENKYE